MGKKIIIHLNVAQQFPSELKQLEVGLCDAEVYDPRLAYLFDEQQMGFWHEQSLLHITNVCLTCVKLIREKSKERVYVFGFCPKTSKLFGSERVEKEES